MIFLDVGAHEGQTLEEVTKPGWGFTTIWAFEPMRREYGKLIERFCNGRGFPGLNVWVVPAGLSDSTGNRPLYGVNDAMEASVFGEKFDVDESIATISSFIDASEFFRDHIPTGERVLVKLNCEGSEVAILDSLIDSGEIEKVENVMIDFDIRKVPGREREERRIIGKLADAGFDRYVLAENVMVGETHQDRIAAWLKAVV